MIKIDVICVGLDKEPYYKDACAEYSKRLGRYCDLAVTVLKDEPAPDNPSDADISAVLYKEGQRILRAIPGRNLCVALCVEGKELSSEDFSSFVSDCSNNYPGITFIIGGSYGLDSRVKDLCKFRLSFSKMTFPHRLMRLILLEQIYRAFTISHGEKYHK